MTRWPTLRTRISLGPTFIDRAELPMTDKVQVQIEMKVDGAWQYTRNSRKWKYNGRFKILNTALISTKWILIDLIGLNFHCENKQPISAALKKFSFIFHKNVENYPFSIQYFIETFLFASISSWPSSRVLDVILPNFSYSFNIETEGWLNNTTLGLDTNNICLSWTGSSIQYIICHKETKKKTKSISINPIFL